MKKSSVLCQLNGINWSAYDSYLMFLKEASLLQGHRKVEPCLTPHCRKDGVDIFLQDYAFYCIGSQWLYVYPVGYGMVSLNGGWIRVNKNNPHTFLTECKTCLGPGIIKF